MDGPKDSPVSPERSSTPEGRRTSPEGVGGEAEVDDASPGSTAGDVEDPPEAVDSSSGHTGNCID